MTPPRTPEQERVAARFPHGAWRLTSIYQMSPDHQHRDCLWVPESAEQANRKRGPGTEQRSLDSLLSDPAFVEEYGR